MSLQFRYVGWVSDPDNNHDKVWTCVKDEDSGRHFIAWGRRGKKLQFKEVGRYEATRKIDEKGGKYTPVDKFMLFAMFPNFEERLAEQLTMAILAGAVR